MLRINPATGKLENQETFWGTILGTVSDQTDLTTYLSNNYLKLDQTTPQTMSGGAFSGSGLIKLTSGLLGVDTNTYLTTSSASTTYVPYTGANANVDLGIYNLAVNDFTASNVDIVSPLTSLFSTNLVAQYKMNDTSGTTVVDSISGNNGVAQQDTSVLHTTSGNPPNLNGALTFNGTSDWIVLNNNFQSTFRNSFTINYWINLNEGLPSHDNVPFNLANPQFNSIEFTVGGNVGTQGTIRWKYTANGSGIFFRSPQVFSSGVTGWHMITGSVEQTDASTILLSLWLDGVLLGSNSGFSIMSSFNPGTHFPYIGTVDQTLGFPVDLNQYVWGAMDNFMIFNKALSQEEIDLLYNSGNGVETLSQTLTLGSNTLNDITNLKAIEELSGTSGFLKKVSAGVWSLDTNTYLTASTLSIVSDAPLSGAGTSASHLTMPAATASNDGYMTSTFAGYLNQAVQTTSSPTFANITDSGLTISKVVFTDGSKQLTSTGIGTSSQFIKGDGSLDSSVYVTAHNLLSATHLDTTTGTVIRGDLVTGQGASPTWNRLAKGTAGKYLTTDANDVIWSTPTLPNSASSTGSYLRCDGTNYIQSTLILPNSATQYRVALATTTNTYGEDAGLTYNTSTDLLSVTNSLTISGGTATTQGLTSTGLLTVTGITGGTSADGSAISITSGIGGVGSNSPGGQGGNISLTTAAGGIGSGGGQAGGLGGDFILTSGSGAAGGAGGSLYGRGGNFTILLGNGAGGGIIAGAGGSYSLTCGNGASGSAIAGAAGTLTLRSGDGNSSSGGATSGGAITVTSGVGGSGATAGTGGVFTMTSGQGGNGTGASTGKGGTGGVFSLAAGNGGTTKNVALLGGTGGSAFFLPGAGGAHTGGGTAGPDGIVGICVTSAGTARGSCGIRLNTPTAWLHLAAGTATANQAPLKFTTGVSNTNAELGALEFTDPNLYFSITDTTVKRKAFVFSDVGGTGGLLTSGRIPYATTNGRLTDAAGFTTDGTNWLYSTNTQLQFSDTSTYLADDGTNFKIVTDNDLKLTCGANKTLELQNVVYEDLQFPVNTGKLPASNFPTYETFTTNTNQFSFAVDDFIDLQANEVPHKWVVGTDASPHLHVTTKAANNTGSNRFAKFTVYFAYADSTTPVETWTETTTTAELTIPTGTAALTSFYLDMPDIALTNNLIGTQIVCRVKRIAATGGTEYSGNIFITQFGVHFQENRIGSRQETVA